MKIISGFFRLVVIFLFTTIILAYKHPNDKISVDYYVDLITNRNQKALDYTFPLDARMYEAKDKFPNGKTNA